MKTLLFLSLFLVTPWANAQVLHETLKDSIEELSSVGVVDNKCEGSDLVHSSTIPIEEKHKYVELGIDTVETANYNGFELSVLSLEQVKKIFEQVNQLEYIPKKYMEDGCYARAHEVFLIAKQNGLSFGKAFVVTDEKGFLYPQGDEMRFHKGFQGWPVYHTSATALVRNEDGTLSPVVFDIGASQKAQKADPWRQSLSPFKDRSKVVYHEGERIFHDSNTKAPARSLLKNLKMTQDTIDELGYDEYLYMLEQGWL